MAHTISAARAKGNLMGKHQILPKEGTRLREAYDLFQANKGKVIPFHTHTPVAIEQLKTTYGLDIRRIKQNNIV